jgi:uncharacterized phiE125 gp8 family phage protein
MKTLKTVTRDSSALISLDDAKDYLRVIGTDEDALITSLLLGSVAYVENYLNRTVGTNTYELSMDSFSSKVTLFRPPVNEVTEITYVDSEGQDQVFDLTKIKLNKDMGILYLKQGETWPATSSEPFSVVVSYSSDGLYAELDANDILTAIKLVLGYQYDWRDDPNQRWRKASDNILRSLRIIAFE